ncbi:MAG: phosphatase PAP2 family protein [Bacteroidota bacterium]
MRLVLFIVSTLFTGLLSGQEFRPYNPSQGPTAGLLGLGGGITLYSTYLGNRVEPMSIEQINSLDANRIWGIDRFSLRHYSLPADEWTDKLLLAAFATPFFNLLSKRGRDNFGDIGLVVFEGALLNAALVNLSKVTAKRARPYNYNPDVPIDIKQSKSARYSFFSGHAATSAFFAFSGAKLYHDLYPDSKARPYVWAAASLIPTFVAYGRMKAGRHFFTDVLTGFVVGTTVALVVPELNKR